MEPHITMLYVLVVLSFMTQLIIARNLGDLCDTTIEAWDLHCKQIEKLKWDISEVEHTISERKN